MAVDDGYRNTVACNKHSQMLKASIRVVSVKSLNKPVPVYIDAACLHNGQIMAIGENVNRRYRTVSEKLCHPCIDVAVR